MEHFVELVRIVSWPITTLWLGFLFRAELRQLLARVSHLKYKDAEATFGRELAQAEFKAATIEASSDPQPALPVEASQVEQLRRIADVSPRAAIMEAWILVETSTFGSGAVSPAFPTSSPTPVIRELMAAGKLPKDTEQLLRQLRELRNKAAHLPDFVVAQDEAERYLELAVKVSKMIRAAGGAS